MKHRVSGKHWLFFILQPYTAFMLRLYYRQFKVIGFNKIPKDKPIILAPNHQNAFMDAIVFLPSFGARRQLSYLVRASIFGTKLGDAFLYRINMMPVYRQIDGLDKLSKNDEIFENCIYLMEKKRVLTLFPEGTHHIRKQMLPLKKGITRITFAAEERNNFDLDIYIFPVGIYYSRLSNYGGNILVQFGNPIRIQDYKEMYAQNPNKAHNQIKTKLSNSLSELMIDIKSSHFYDCIELCREIDNNDKGNFAIEKDFKNSKEVIRKIEKLIDENEDKAVELKSLSERYQEKLNETEFRDKIFSHSSNVPGFMEKLLFYLISPIGIYGWLNNFFPFMIPNWLAEKRIKDVGFKSSIKSAAAMLIFPFFYLVQTAISIFILPEWWMILVYFLSLPLSFYIGLWWRRKLKKFAAYDRLNGLENSEQLKEIIYLRKEITTILNSL